MTSIDNAGAMRVKITHGSMGIPVLVPVYPSGINFYPLTYPWVEKSSHTRDCIG